MKRIICALSILAILLSCSKENTFYQNQPNPELRDGGGTVFILDGEVVDSTEINWSSDNLNVVVGFCQADTVLVFSGDASLVDWIENIPSSQSQIFSFLLELKDTALIVADAMDEFEYVETYGDHSLAYQSFLDSFLHGGSRGATKLFEHNNYGGINETYWVSKGYVGNRMNNKTSSMQFGPVGGFLADWKWWSGKKFWYWTISQGYHPSLPNFNDKATSILIY